MGKGSGQKRDAYTPVMQQYLRAKDAYPDAIVLFRLGDFYELFFDDAVKTAAMLDIALTSRGTGPDGEPIPMAGVPHHAVASYLQRLLDLGQSVALCEQMGDPSKVRGVVPREVVRVITPGLCVDLDALDARAEHYLACVTSHAGAFGLAALELSTGQLRACSLADEGSLLAELIRLSPREVLVRGDDDLRELVARALPTSTRRALPEKADADALGLARKALGPSGAAFMHEIETMPMEARWATAEALAYAKATQPATELDLQRVETYDPSAQLVLDETAVRSLELVQTLSGERRGSLLHHLDRTRTPMGARLLRRRLLSPLSNVAAIRRRHDQVETFLESPSLRARVREILAEVGDLERMSTRASLGLATPRDLGVVRTSLRAIDELGRSLDALEDSLDDPLAGIRPGDVCADVRAELERALVDAPPVVDKQGGIFREGYLPELDELRRLSEDSKDVVQALERRERERTGIPSLKVKFTRVFGYYIEVTRAHLASVPSEYQRKQTVANAERYVTEELADLQDKILNAEERAKAIEAERFTELREMVARHAKRLRELAEQVAAIDTASTLAEVADHDSYVRPTIDESRALELTAARHPIVESLAAAGAFVPNDTTLDADGERLWLVTGPNMAGKSTVMRQVALVVILAQMGSFVPAERARIGLVDKIFSRVGARDDLASGQSTFMMEMRETAAMLRGATKRSLVILDEIGRGTSTYDGLAIAWAVAEHIHDAIGCRAMFATHYHELCELAETRSGAASMNVAAEEFGDDVVFLHRLVRGGASRSYGVAVARLAGVPAIVLARAKAILGELEGGGALPSGTPSRMRRIDAEGRAQLDLFGSAEAPPPAPSVVEETLAELDVDRMTPVDALVALARLKGMLEG
jgi:DNA mismatch repair protein MutS